jgi:hypothetical protein
MLSALLHARSARQQAERSATEAVALAPHLDPEINRWKADRDGLVEMLASQLAVSADGWSSRRRMWRSRARGVGLKLSRNDPPSNSSQNV